MLKSPISIDSYNIKLTFIICTIMVCYEKYVKLKLKNVYNGTRTTGHMLYRLMAAYTIVFYVLLSMNSRLCRLVKINFVFLKDTAFISSKSDFDQCTDCWVISVPKMQTDRQTDSFSALYNRCMAMVDAQIYYISQTCIFMVERS